MDALLSPTPHSLAHDSYQSSGSDQRGAGLEDRVGSSADLNLISCRTLFVQCSREPAMTVRLINEPEQCFDSAGGDSVGINLGNHTEYLGEHNYCNYSTVE